MIKIIFVLSMLFAQFAMGSGVTSMSNYNPTNVTITGGSINGVSVVNITGSTMLHVRDEKASGTDGGASVAGSQTRDLNTIVTNTIAGATLVSNQVTLPAGTYRIFAAATAYRAGKNRLRLFNVTDGIVAIYGMPSFADITYLGASNSILSGRVTIASPKVFTLTQHTQYAVATNGLGLSVVDTYPEIYSYMIIVKE